MGSLLYEEHKRLGGLPSTQVKVEALMLHVPQIYNITQLLQNPFFYRYFEVSHLIYCCTIICHLTFCIKPFDHYQRSILSLSYKPTSFQIANLYWLNDGYKFLFPKIPFSPRTFRTHALLVGHSLNISDLKTVRYGSKLNLITDFLVIHILFSGHSFVYGTRLRYAAMVINTTIPRQGLSYDQGLGVFDKWEKFFENLVSLHF